MGDRQDKSGFAVGSEKMNQCQLSSWHFFGLEKVQDCPKSKGKYLWRTPGRKFFSRTMTFCAPTFSPLNLKETIPLICFSTQ